MVDEAVDGGAGVAEHFAPAAERLVGGDDDRRRFVAGGDEVEEQVHPHAWLRQRLVHRPKVLSSGQAAEDHLVPEVSHDGPKPARARVTGQPLRSTDVWWREPEMGSD